MCYSVSIFSGTQAYEDRFNAKVKGEHAWKYFVSAFEQQEIPVITNTDPDEIQFFRWGLIPSWVKERSQAEEIAKKTVNARAESIYEKPAFRRSAEKHHCLVLVDGFFEWREYNGGRYPYFIRCKVHEPFALAGLWDVWEDPVSQEVVSSVSVITCEANPLLAMIHNTQKRMPVIIPREIERQWLDVSLPKNVSSDLLSPVNDSILEAYTVSRRASYAKFDRDVPEVIEPHEYPEIGSRSNSQSTLF